MELEGRAPASAAFYRFIVLLLCSKTEDVGLSLVALYGELILLGR